jgi:hypothetical protein
MYPWFFLWAPQYHFPWSGGVKQDIAPDTTAFFNAIAPSAGDGRIEKAIFEVASYGKQIGILSEVVLSLVAQDQITAAEAKQAIDQLIQLNKDVKTIKDMHAKHRADAAIGILEKLQESDPEEVQRIVARFQRRAVGS